MSGGVVHDGPSADLPATADELAAAFEVLTDLVVVLSADGTILYLNSFTTRLLGWEPEQTVGDNIAGYVHPDDLDRAVEVLGLVVTGSVGAVLTPAVYRLKRRDGSWCPIEMNGATFLTSGDAGLQDPTRALLMGRYLGDQDIQNRIIDVLSSGRPLASAIKLVPEFGSWRHPDDHYAVVYSDPRFGVSVTGDDLALGLTRLDQLDSPWARALESGEDQAASLVELPEAIRPLAADHDMDGCRVVTVTDPNSSQVAVLVIWLRQSGPTWPVHLFAVETMIQALRLVLRWSGQLSELERAARHDALTGAINRSWFFHLLGAVEPSSTGLVGVCYADLDGFKTVNDAHGHTVGDAVLREVAARLDRALDDGHKLCRLGGDEFAVLCPGLTRQEEAGSVAERLVRAMDDPIAIGDLRLNVGVSVGVATASPATVQPDRLVDRADRALYEAKAEGRNCWRLAADLV